MHYRIPKREIVTGRTFIWELHITRLRSIFQIQWEGKMKDEQIVLVRGIKKKATKNIKMVVVLGTVFMISIFMEKYLRLHVWKERIWNSNAEAFVEFMKVTVAIYYRDKWSWRKQILMMWNGLIQGITLLVIKRGVQQQTVNSKII